MKNCFYIFFFVILLSSSAFAYGYKTVSCSGGIPNSSAIADIQLVNSGGMNIFYFASSEDQLIQNIYSNVTKIVRVPVWVDSTGNYSIDVSTNYNDNFTLTCVSTDSDAMAVFSSNFLMGLAGICCSVLLVWSVQAAFLS